MKPIGLPTHDAPGVTPGLCPLRTRLVQNDATTNMLVEGGGGLNGALTLQDWSLKIMVLIAPKSLGDGWGFQPVRPSPDVRGTERVADASPWHLVEVEWWGAM